MLSILPKPTIAAKRNRRKQQRVPERAAVGPLRKHQRAAADLPSLYDAPRPQAHRWITKGE